MEEVCSKCCVSSEYCRRIMGNYSYIRPLGPTLVGAMATFAVFVAANWELAPLVDNEITERNPRMLMRCMIHIRDAIMQPLNAFLFTVENFCIVLLMRRKFAELHKGREGSVNDITSCPILIQIPSGFKPSRDDLFVNDEKVKKFHPLELSPAAGAKQLDDGVDIPEDRSQLTAGSQLDIDVAAGAKQLDDGVDITEDQSQLAAGSQLDIDVAPAAGYQPAADDVAAAPNKNDHESRYYIRMKSGNYRFKDVKQRAALLKLGLVPEYEKLGILRSRGAFRVIVCMLQAVGSLGNLSQRWVAGLGISPLEAIINYLCLLITLQLLLELYACNHYQRHLLLRLTPFQFRRFLEESQLPSPRKQLHEQLCDPEYNPFSEHKKAMIFAALFCFLMILACFLVIPAPLFYYSFSMGHHCPMCAVSTFIFWLYPIAYVLIIVTTWVVARPHFKAILMNADLPLSLGALVNVSSIILSLVATVLHWEMFNTSRGDILYAWLLPYISSS